MLDGSHTPGSCDTTEYLYTYSRNNKQLCRVYFLQKQQQFYRGKLLSFYVILYCSEQTESLFLFLSHMTSSVLI